MDKTPEEICKEMKGHLKGLRNVLQGFYGDPATDGSPDRRKWPVRVRDRAREALIDFNRGWTLEAELGFDELHMALGLGPANWSGQCGHECLKDTDKRGRDARDTNH